MIQSLTSDHWQSFNDLGYARLGRISDASLRRLQDRIDAIMLGHASARYDRMLMQLDSETGRYEDAGEQSCGFKGANLNYRKIQDLEWDPVFLEFLQQPVFRDLCAELYLADTPISVFRAMFMNKPAQRGTFLPWHQDRWTFLSEDPLVTVWTALDPATRANGCVQVVPRSHRLGLINPDHPSGFLTPAQAEEYCSADKIEFLELDAGEVVLLHNHLLHASDINRSSHSRRAFSVCYMPARTRHRTEGTGWPIVFGEGALCTDAVTATLGA